MPVKRRLRQPPLPPPEISLADQQSLSEQPFRGFLAQRALVKLILLEDQHLLDVVWVIQQNPALQDHGNPHDIAILARRAAHHLQRISQQIQGHAEKRQSFRPWQRAISVCRSSIPLQGTASAVPKLSASLFYFTVVGAGRSVIESN